MASFSIKEQFICYNELQICLVHQYGSSIEDVKTYIACHTLDEGIFLATRICDNQFRELKIKKACVNYLMNHPYQDEIYILLDSRHWTSYLTNNTHTEFYGFPVDSFNTAFEAWAIPDPGLYYEDIW